MRLNITIPFFLLVLLTSSCNIEKQLPVGSKLYKGALIKITKNAEVKESNRSLKTTIALATRPSRNKFILGFPYKVWFWYKIGTPKKENGLKVYLRKKFAEPPVLNDRINVASASENIQSLLENLGYFHSTAKGDTISDKQYCTAVYTVHVEPQYLLNEIKWVSDSANPLINLLENKSNKNGLLVAGKPYRLSDITAERERLDLYLKTKGYYYFHPDFLMAYADSTIGNRKVNLLFNIKKSAPPESRRVYKIATVSVYPDYSLSNNLFNPDSIKIKYFDKLIIKQNEPKFNSKLFASAITYRPDTIYNSRFINATLNRFINLGAFKFVKNKFDTVVGTNHQNELAVSYFLTPSKKKSFQASIDGFSKDNSYVGSKVGVNWKNKNVFGGAEQLVVKAYGGFEVALADSLKVNNNFRAGTEISLKFPRYAIPFLKLKENSFYPANTTIGFGYEWYTKKLYYTKNFFRFQYEFIKKPTANSQFNFAPVSLSYVNSSNVTDSFYRQAALNPSLLTTIYPETILGTYFSYSWFTENKKHKWYFNTGLDLSGNLAGFITGAKNYREKVFIKVPFAQFVKLDLDIHYTIKLNNKISFANRFLIGLGIPYHNSKVLPFSKLYTIGGASSLRGFNAGGIGPGSLKPSALNQGLYQIIGGDMKLLFNTELRIPFSKYLSYAFFVDAGNTWTKDTLLFGPTAKISRNFYKEIAVSSGMGLRFDATILLIRFDFGVPLRKPFLPDGNKWVINNLNFGNTAWRKENLIFNIAIGLPF